jgi:hypothetical protein
MICPRCGASLPPSPGAAYVTCHYCGTQSPVNVAPVPPGAPVASQKKSGFPLGASIALAVGLVVAGGGAVAAFLLSGPVPKPTRTVSTAVLAREVAKTGGVSAPSSPTAASSPSAAPAPTIESRFTPLVSDINGDGAEDFVVVGSVRDPGYTLRYFGFDGVTGNELFRTKDLGSSVTSSQAVLVHERLLIADNAGKVTAFDPKSGDEQWSTTLGDRVSHFCVAKEPESARALTADDRVIALDVKTGRQTPVPGKPKCEREKTSARDSFKLPEDRSDPRAPSGVKSVVCGSVRVMGDRNFVVPDQCPIQTGINPDRLDGMSASAFWKVGKGWLVLGFRKPGTRIPMLGYHAGGKLVWKREVPPKNPLAAFEGPPSKVALAKDRVFAAFDVKDSSSGSGITALDLATGAPSWAVVFKEKRESVSHLVATGETVVALVDGRALGFGAADGKKRFTIGKQD